MKIKEFHLFVYTLPLKHPLTIGTIRLKSRTGYIIQLIDRSGNIACGDIAPLPGLQQEISGETIVQIGTVLKKYAGSEFPDSIQDAALWMANEKLPAAACFGIESAIARLYALRNGVSLREIFSESFHNRIPVNALLWGDSRTIHKRAKQSVDAGYTCVKLKVGRQQVEEDILVVKEVSKILDGRSRLRLDANCAWTVEQAIQFAGAITEIDIEFIEEPLHDPALLPAFFKETGLAYALDENLQDAGNEDQLSAAGCRALILKPAVIGGIFRTLNYIKLAKKKGIAAVLSDTFHSGVGIYVTASLAATGKELNPAAGLDTWNWLQQDILMNNFSIKAGEVDLTELDQSIQQLDYSRLKAIEL